VSTGNALALAHFDHDPIYATSPTVLLGDVNGDRADDLIEALGSGAPSLAVAASQGSWFERTWGKASVGQPDGWPG